MKSVLKTANGAPAVVRVRANRNTKPLSQHEVDRAIALRGEGYTIRKIAKELCRGYSSICAVFSKKDNEVKDGFFNYNESWI
jgi:hypothetical protein